MTTVLLPVCRHTDRVAWGSSAGTKSASRAHSLVVYHHVGARLEKRKVVEDQLQLGGEVYAEIEDGYATGNSARHGVARSGRGFVSFQRLCAPADPPTIGVFLLVYCVACTPPLYRA